MRAPSRSAPPRLAGVTVVGITTVARTPNSFAASATACAWLPDDGAITPRDRSSALIFARKLYAPRSLNAPPRCSVSGLSQTGAPMRSVSSSAGRSGVRTTTPAMVRAASRRSSSVMSGEGMPQCPLRPDWRQHGDERLRADPIPSAGLCFVQRPVRALEQVVVRDRVAPLGQCDADRDRDREGAAGFELEAVLVHVAPQALGEGHRALPGGVGKHDHELVATDTGDGVRLACGAPHDLAELGEHRVAGGVAVAVVDLLEMVDVDHQDRQRRAAPLRLAPLARQPRLEGTAAHAPGQDIGPDQLDQPAAHLVVALAEERQVVGTLVGAAVVLAGEV